ncbi:MAG TPA: extracellular solute-binding protein, partial [Spirochaetia bacterium]|nr:extracellular solute-binding protein [Spirochaetia bacterium]
MKQIAFVILIMMLAVPVFASGEKEAASKAGPAEITFWHIWDGTRTPLIEQEIADFNKIHPEIKVSHTLIAAQGMQEKYLTAIAGGDPPNVIMIRGADIPAFASRKALVLLDGYVKKDGLKLDEIFFEGEIKSHYYKGSAYSLPVVTGGGNFMLLWNKSIFKEAGLDPEKGPTTWDDMYEISKRLAQLEGGKLKRMALNPLAGGSIPARNTPYQVWSFGNNASYMSEDGKQITLDSKEGVETLEYILKLIDLYGGIENVASISGPDRNTNRLAFYN